MGFSMLLHMGEDFCRFYIHRYTCHVQQQHHRSSASLAVVVGDAQVRVAVAQKKKQKQTLTPSSFDFCSCWIEMGREKKHTRLETVGVKSLTHFHFCAAAGAAYDPDCLYWSPSSTQGNDIPRGLIFPHMEVSITPLLSDSVWRGAHTWDFNGSDRMCAFRVRVCGGFRCAITRVVLCTRRQISISRCAPRTPTLLTIKAAPTVCGDLCGWWTPHCKFCRLCEPLP